MAGTRQKKQSKGHIYGEERERLALRNKGEKEGTRRYIRGVLREDIGMKTYLLSLARPNGLRCEEAETAISCRGPGPTRKKKEISEDVDAHTYVPVWHNNIDIYIIESRTHSVEGEIYREKYGMC